MKRIAKRGLLLLASLACFAVAFAAINTFEVWRYSRVYSESPSDAAIVLGAGSASGKLSAVFVERLNHAMTLFNQGTVDRIILTGGFGEGQKISDSQAAKNFIVSKGAPEEAVLIEEKSTITYENLREAREVMASNGMKTALVVSDPLHMKRAMAICKSLDIDAKPSPTPTTMYRSRNTKLKLLMYEAFFYNAQIFVGPFWN